MIRLADSNFTHAPSLKINIINQTLPNKFTFHHTHICIISNKLSNWNIIPSYIYLIHNTYVQMFSQIICHSTICNTTLISCCRKHHTSLSVCINLINSHQTKYIFVNVNSIMTKKKMKKKKKIIVTNIELICSYIKIYVHIFTTLQFTKGSICILK